MHIPDPIERMEARIEDLLDEQLQGVPDGKIRCYGCKEVVGIDAVESLSDRPDAPAYCFKCVADYYARKDQT